MRWKARVDASRRDALQLSDTFRIDMSGDCLEIYESKHTHALFFLLQKDERSFTSLERACGLLKAVKRRRFCARERAAQDGAESRGLTVASRISFSEKIRFQPQAPILGKVSET